MERRGNGSGTRLTLDLWHPNCWAIEATESAPGGVLAHAIYHAPKAGTETGTVNGLFTAFADSNGGLEELLDGIESSAHSGELMRLQERFGTGHAAPGNVAREFFLEYDPGDMICPVLLEHGFVHSEPVRIEDGREYWRVGFAGERSGIESALEGVRGDANAEVSVERIASTNGTGRSERRRRLDSLTSTQREVFELARAEGYYEWPRGISTRDLAAELDVSKTTLLEHLRKAESKLLDPASQE